jgi:uncharacterized protein YceH (UPF0502 family)
MRPLATVLPRQPGSREARYAHLLGGPVEAAVRESGGEPHRQSAGEPSLAGRVAELETEVAELRAAVARIEERLGAAASGAEPRGE